MSHLVTLKSSMHIQRSSWSVPVSHNVSQENPHLSSSATKDIAFKHVAKNSED